MGKVNKCTKKDFHDKCFTRLVSKHLRSNFFRNSYGQVLSKTQTAFLKNYCNVDADTVLRFSNGCMLLSQVLFEEDKPSTLKLHLHRFENHPVCPCSYKNNTLKNSHS